jgi:hypothetical protein
VIVQIGQELHYLVYNNSGATLTNGTPVYVSDYNSTFDIFEIDSAKASGLRTAVSTLGLVTADIPDQSLGLVTFFGKVRNVNTSAFTSGLQLYLDEDGGLTQDKPNYPNEVIIIGGCLNSNATTGSIAVFIQRYTRPNASKSYSFTSGAAAAGEHWVAGYYDFNSADANLNQASTTVNYGTANVGYGAHASIVAADAGAVNTGTVGIRVTGTSVTDLGVRTATDADTILTDITTMVTDTYYETDKKFIGQVTFELIATSGTPTTYSADFNYGFAKYEDVGNRDFSVSGIEAVGRAGANDTGFDIELYHHTSSGWTYAATGFEPGNSVLASWSGSYVTEVNLANGIPFAWKRTDLNQFIDGDGSEGVVIKVTTGANNSIQFMDVHLSGRIESF